MVGINFVDTELTFPVRPQETVDFTFQTSIIEKIGGQERRRPVRTEYRMNISIGTLTLVDTCDDEDNEIHEYDALLEFYKTVGGNLGTFRYKNFFDYKVTKDPETYIPIATASFTSPITYSLAKLLTGSIFQLIKVYSVGTVRTTKTLRLIDEATLEVFVDDVQTFNYTVDNQLGQIEILDALGGSEVVTFNCEFYLEMRFSMDTLQKNEKRGRNNESIKEVTGITLIEEVTTTDFIGILGDYVNLDDSFKLPLVPEYSSDTAQEIRVESLLNERESRDPRYTDIADTFSYSANTNKYDEAWYVATWFIACKGRLLGFKFEDELTFARFDTDSLKLTAIALQPTAATQASTNALVLGTGALNDCGDTIRIEQFTILGKEAITLAPPLPDFIADEDIEFIDIAVGFTPDPDPLPGTYSGAANGSTGGVGGAGGGGAGDGTGGFGLSSGAAPDPIFPINFDPLCIGEISSAPVVLGRSTATNNLLLAIPNFPYDGTFTVNDLLIPTPPTSSSTIKFRYNGISDAIYAAFRDTSGGNQVYLLKVDTSLNYSLLPCGVATSDPAIHRFYSYEDIIAWLEPFSTFTTTPPATIDGLRTYLRFVSQGQHAAFPHGDVNIGTSNPDILDRTLAMYPDNLGTGSRLPTLPAAPKDTIYNRRSGAWDLEFDFPNTTGMLFTSSDFNHGGYDHRNGNWGFMYSNFRLYDPIDLTDYTSEVGVLRTWAGFFENTDGNVFWYGVIEPVASPGEPAPFTWERGSVFYGSRTLIAKQSSGSFLWSLVNIPLGTKINFDDIINISVNPLSVSYGQTYVVVLFNNAGWRIGFLNFTNT